MKKAVFLDRDGVINKNGSKIDRPERFIIIKGVPEAIRKLNDANFMVIIVTNQPEIAKGFFGFKELDVVHNSMKKQLAEKNAKIDLIFVCPHHPEKGWPGEVAELKIECECRKPKPGMLLKAIKKFDINPDLSWMVGDSKGDIVAGQKAGVKTIRVTEGGGSGAKQEEEIYAKPDFTFENLEQAVDKILLGNLSENFL